MLPDQMMFVEWIVHEIARTGVKQVEVARVMGLDASKMSKSLKGDRRFQPEELQAASALFRSPIPTRRKPLIGTYDPDAPDRRIGDLDQPPDFDPTAAANPNLFPEDAIKELVARGAMGSGQVISNAYNRDGFDILTQDEVKNDYWRFPDSFVRNVMGAQVANLIAIECEGDSMLPTLAPGERVWVNTAHKIPSPDGIYAIRDPLEFIIIKRLELIAGSPPRLRVLSDNSMHGPKEYALDQVAIVGKVVAGLRLF